MVRTQDESPIHAMPGAVSRMMFGSQEHGGMIHKSGHTPVSLARQIASLGFTVKQAWLGHTHRYVFTGYPVTHSGGSGGSVGRYRGRADLGYPVALAATLTGNKLGAAVLSIQATIASCR